MVFNVVGIGELVWDVYPDCKYIGGSAANFAIHANQLGDRGIIVSRIGKDDQGSEIITALTKRNINVSYIQIDPQKRTGIVYITPDKHGIPNYKCSTDVAFDYLQYEQVLEKLAPTIDAVYFDLIAQRNLIAHTTIHSFLQSSSRAFKIFDMNIRKWSPEINSVIRKSLKIADAIKANADEIKLFQQVNENNILEFVTFLLTNYDIKLAAITLGENGCYLLDSKQIIESHSGINSNIIDTTGAGDAFTAAVVHKYLRGAPLDEIANFANAVAINVTKYRGATPIYP